MAIPEQPVAEFITQSSSFHQQIRSIYEPLDPDRLQIRLMHILPGKYGDDAIKVTLSIVDLEDGPVYDALSYTWDSLTPTVTINLCDAPYEVTTNQYSALRRLRLPDVQRTIWMDVTCINQTDLVERGRQVSIMGEIYAHAAQTRVWLGEPQPSWSEVTDDDWNARLRRLDLCPDYIAYMTRWTRDSSAEMMPAFLECVTEEPEGILKGALHILKLLVDRVSIRSMPYCGFDAEGNIQHCRYFYHATKMLISLFQRPWWTRVWVVQEACLSKAVPLVHIGGQQISIRTFADTRHGYMHGRDPQQSDDFWLSDIYDISALAAAARRMITYGSLLGDADAQFGRLSLPLGLSLVNARNASDRRDFVYGIMGVIHKNHRVPIDYNLNIAQVFSLTSWRAYTHYATGFNLLKYAAGVDATDTPSWAVDWGRRDELHFSDSDLFDAEQADQDLTRCRHFDVMLQLPANKIDTIQIVLENLDDADSPSSDQVLGFMLSWTHQLHAAGFFQHADLLANDFSVVMPFFTTIVRETRTDEHNNRVRFAIEDDWEDFIYWFINLSLAAEAGDKDAADEMTLSKDFCSALRGSRLCVTERGRLCMVKSPVRAGDVLYHIRGCSMLIALRAADPQKLRVVEQEDGSLMERMVEPFRVVGPCYLTGAMGLDGANPTEDEILYLV